MAQAYSFVSRWQTPVPAPRAWAELERMLRPGAGPTWWPGLRIVEPPEALVAGERLALLVRSPLGYRLRVRLTLTEVEPGRSIAAASTGDLRGAGRVVVAEAGEEASVVVFHWDVSTERAWMNATAFALRPVFGRAHTAVMRAGERGMRTALAGGLPRR